MENIKKIGLLTYHTPDNYGAVYQAFALQRYIQNTHKKKIEIIDFCTDKHISAYNIFKRRSNNPIKNIILQFLTLLKYPMFKDKKNKYKKFREKYLQISSNRYHTEEEFLQHNNRYNIYIVGSDQVFNPNNEYLKAYYLGFPKNGCRKIAYAPSFGISDFNENITSKILPYLNDFDMLSCREKQGAEYMSSILGYKVKQVIDPVFLLEKEVWKKISIEPKEKKKYIFIYDLAGAEKLAEIARKINKAKDFKIICASAQILKRYAGCDMRYDIGPCELLGYIKNAEYVVTDSFHGTSLSLIMRKKIITYIALPHSASRITSIMESLGTTEQIVTDITNFDINKIRFNKYDNKLFALVNESKEYIKESLI